MHPEAIAILAELQSRWKDIQPTEFAKACQVSRTWLIALALGQIPDPSVNRMFRVRDALRAQFG